MASEPTFTLKLTRRQLWHLQESYEASFTDPNSKSEIQQEVTELLHALSLKANRKRRTTP